MKVAEITSLDHHHIADSAIGLPIDLDESLDVGLRSVLVPCTRERLPFDAQVWILKACGDAVDPRVVGMMCRGEIRLHRSRAGTYVPRSESKAASRSVNEPTSSKRATVLVFHRSRVTGPMVS
ncbi:hypothetical protein D7D52_13780 [Nocardia yunnanensis]|uniref:Uncharacterized protein n=1 Tax=Nocardia yunnanensis TaxID=2382165 RepID=A0A386ZBU0_9NOCA|nr:hypothetical protein D7D52_13780 [Nocardia yunnanensis]